MRDDGISDSMLPLSNSSTLSSSAAPPVSPPFCWSGEHLVSERISNSQADRALISPTADVNE